MFLRSSANSRYCASAWLVIATLCVATLAVADDTDAFRPDAPTVERYVRDMWSGADDEWKKRLQQDETQAVCSKFRNAPPEDIADALRAREAATVVYPADGNLLGNWREGEKIAQNGRGGQFSDAPDATRGGNCYACHQMAKTEVSYGTLGPSLSEYGKLRGFSSEAAKEAYAKVYNSQASLPCSMMPRFGVHGFLSEQQIKDVIAYLFDAESPVNK